jgi:Cu-Zn family superoxide dismutase
MNQNQKIYFATLLIIYNLLTVKSSLKASCTLVGPTLTTSTLTLSQSLGQNLSIMGTITGSGITANAKHGFHVHTYGLTGDSGIGNTCHDAGSHYDPNNQNHGDPAETSPRHVGDLGNVVADTNGKITVSINDTIAKIYELQSIIGRAIVIHSKEDDFQNVQHSGNAGSRLGCCVIVEIASTTVLPPDTYYNKLIMSAYATIKPNGYSGSVGEGSVTVTKTDSGLKYVVSLTGLVANSKHGLHVHQYGYTGTDCSTTGGHWNPDNKNAGDLGNVKSDSNGSVSTTITSPYGSLIGLNSIIGKGFTLHANTDDYTTQATGNAGSHLACGQIGVATENFQKNTGSIIEKMSAIAVVLFTLQLTNCL